MSPEIRNRHEAGLQNETVVKRAPVVTAAELLGRKLPETGELNLSESPIHGFRIERPTGVEVFAVMPDAKMGTDSFVSLLGTVAPNKDGRARQTIIDDYRPIDPNHEYCIPSLPRLHRRLGDDWTDFMKHYPLFGQTVIEDDEEILKSLVVRGHYFAGDFEFRGLEVEDEVWSTDEKVRLNIGLWNNPKPDATLALRKVYGRFDPNEEDYINYYKDEDKSRIPLRLRLTDEGYNLEVLFRDTLKADISSLVLEKGRVHLRSIAKTIFNSDNIHSTNVLVPAFRLGRGENGEREWRVDHIEGEKEKEILDEYVAGYALPEGLHFDHHRFNPLVGLLTAAHVSPDVTAMWPISQGIGKGRPNMMGSAQVPVLALQRRNELLLSPFAEALTNHVDKFAA